MLERRYFEGFDVFGEPGEGLSILMKGYLDGWNGALGLYSRRYIMIDLAFVSISIIQLGLH